MNEESEHAARSGAKGKIVIQVQGLAESYGVDESAALHFKRTELAEAARSAAPSGARLIVP